MMALKDSQSPLTKQKSYAESQDSSSFAGGVADQNYMGLSSEDEESKGGTEHHHDSKELLALGERSASQVAASLPDMWNQTDAKRGDF